MVVFSAIGLLLLIALVLVAMVLCWTIAGLSRLLLRLMDVKPRLTDRNPAANSRRNVTAVQPRALPPATSDIWPKWTESYRQYMDRELFLWQEQFDALNSRNV